jgi:FecR-like protein
VQRRQFISFLASLALWPVEARAQAPAAPDQPAPSDQPGQTPPDQADQGGAGGDNSIGQVSTVQGSATVTRANAAPIALKASDPIYKNDELMTAANAALGVTFDDNTTFNLTGSSRIVVDDYVYQQGASGNVGAFSVTQGTVAFVASEVAKTGNMTITTPTATLGIRGTTGVVDVPVNAATGGEAKIKLYPDADGRVGHIDVFDRQGGRLGALTQGSSAFQIQRGAGGRFAAVAFRIPPQEAARDRGVVQRLFASHNIGRRMTIQRQQLRQRNLRQPNNLRRQNGPQQQNRNPNFRQQQQPRGPGQQQQNRGPNFRQNGGPGQPQPNNGQPGQRRTFRERLRNLNPFNRRRDEPNPR